jgi:hypothetical protein
MYRDDEKITASSAIADALYMFAHRCDRVELVLGEIATDLKFIRQALTCLARDSITVNEAKPKEEAKKNGSTKTGIT